MVFSALTLLLLHQSLSLFLTTFSIYRPFSPAVEARVKFEKFLQNGAAPTVGRDLRYTGCVKGIGRTT